MHALERYTVRGLRKPRVRASSPPLVDRDREFRMRRSVLPDEEIAKSVQVIICANCCAVIVLPSRFSAKIRVDRRDVAFFGGVFSWAFLGCSISPPVRRKPNWSRW